MAKKAVEEKAGYTMPPIGMGETVLWFDEATASEATAMALVTQVGRESVSLGVLAPGYHNFLVKEGVRYRGDPDKDAIRHTEVGCWDYRPEDLAQKKLLDQLAVLADAAR